jgi:hypothetical protein
MLAPDAPEKSAERHFTAPFRNDTRPSPTTIASM